MSTERQLIGCALHDGADIDACGCPALDSPGAIAYRGLLVKARAEIARLTAELAAARAVPADVEAALDTWAQSEIFAAESEYEPRDSARADANRDILRATIARAISEATATTSTVGGLLATRCCSKCRGISSHTPGGIPCDECGLVGSMPWGG